MLFVPIGGQQSALLAFVMDRVPMSMPGQLHHHLPSCPVRKHTWVAHNLQASGNIAVVSGYVTLLMPSHVVDSQSHVLFKKPSSHSNMFKKVFNLLIECLEKH